MAGGEDSWEKGRDNDIRKVTRVRKSKTLKVLIRTLNLVSTRTLVNLKQKFDRIQLTL